LTSRVFPRGSRFSRSAITARWWIAVGVAFLCAIGPQSIAATMRNKTTLAIEVPARAGRPALAVAHPVILSGFSAVDRIPDGNLNEPFWTSAARVRFDEAGFTREKYPGAETMVASRWTANYLYIAFWCRYQTLNTFDGEDPAPERWGLWERDVVEAFINPTPEHPSHYYEFEIAPTNQWIDLEINLDRKPFNDPKWNSGFLHATRIDPARHIWTAEMRIPIHSMKVKEIRPGAEWRVNFYRNDGPGTGHARRNLSWGPLPSGTAAAQFHQPASFGTIRFVGSGD
jgi:hypothetical protein